MSLQRYKRLLPYLTHHWPLLMVMIGLTFLYSVMTALQPWPLKILVDYALGDAALPEFLRVMLERINLANPSTVLVILAALSSLLLYFVNAALDASLSMAWATVGQKTVYDLSEAMFGKLQRLSLQFHRYHAIGDSLSRLSGDAYSVYTLTDTILVSPIRHCVLLITIGFVSWQLDPSLTLLAFLVVPFMVAVSIFCGAYLKKLMHHYRQAQSELMTFVHQTLTSIPIVQAFGTEDANRYHFERLSRQSITLSQQNHLFKSLFNATNGSISVISTATVLFIGGSKVLAGVITVGSLIVLLDYLRSIQTAFKGLFANYGTLKSLEASVERIFEILDSDDKIPEPTNPVTLPTTQVQGNVEFKQVTFGYEPNTQILKQISFTAQSGETIAIVGETGAGKSTLVSAILRFFDPWKGEVLIDGIDLRDLPLDVVRSQSSLVLQDPFLLPLSIANNIAYGRPDATYAQITQAAKLSNAHEFINQLPLGYDTVIGERGSTLSGGQKQRIAIARALLKDAPILILDEPTSALDAQTETLIMDAMERLMAGRTTFIIAHRLSTVKQADRILVLDQGRIAEEGTHQDLLDAKGIYSRLHYLQVSKSLGKAV